MVIQRKGEHNKRTRIIDRSAQPQDEELAYHIGDRCAKEETPYLHNLKKEVERRRRAGLLPAQGRPERDRPAEDAACAGCGQPAVEGRILCKSCQVSTAAKGQTLPFICLVPGCGEHRAQWRKGDKCMLRPYCIRHWYAYQGRSRRARMKRREAKS